MSSLPKVIPTAFEERPDPNGDGEFFALRSFEKRTS